MEKIMIQQTHTILTQARVITGLAEENKKLMEINARIDKHNFELIKGNAVLAARCRDIGVGIRELRKQLAGRGR